MGNDEEIQTGGIEKDGLICILHKNPGLSNN